MKKAIYIIGDSHVSVFGGRDMVLPKWPLQVPSVLKALIPIHIGPITAHNLDSESATTQGKQLITEVLSAANAKSSRVLISAGEIDCRVHLLKQAQRNHRPVEECVRTTVERFVGFLKDLRSEIPHIAVLGPPATPFAENQDPLYPKYGTELERNAVTRSFVRQLHQECEACGVQMLNSFEWTVDSKLKTRRRYYWDQVHLGTKAFPNLVRQLENTLDIKLPIPIGWRLKELMRSYKQFSQFILTRNANPEK